MKVERELHMSCGNQLRHQLQASSLSFPMPPREKAMVHTRPLLHRAAEEAHACLSSSSGRPTSTMVAADLGCSSGPNTLLFVSEVLGAIVGRCEQLGQPPAVNVQFFLSDLPGNDFNLIFQSLELFGKVAAEKGKKALPPYYVAGLPGSFYTRLFPESCVHLFHSYCLMWRSNVPEELATGAILNEGNIYIYETTLPSVVELYQEQFRKDFSLFLELRHTELVADGQMVLTFMGRKNGDVLLADVSYMWGLLAQALQALVQEGRVEKEKLQPFNLPFYAPSVDEVKAAVEESELFDISHAELFETNWDPLDDSDGDLVLDSVQSGVNVARCVRAVAEPLVGYHFGVEILDGLFEMYAQNVAKHLEKVKPRCPVIGMSLKARHRA